MELARAANLFVLAQKSRVRARYGLSVERAQKARVRNEKRWKRELAETWPSYVFADRLDFLIEQARRDWANIDPEWRTVDPDELTKARIKDLVDLFGRVVLAIRTMFAESAEGSKSVYLGLADDTAEDAGQHTLDTLGLDKTWRWTDVRDIDRDTFQVRGSKVIQRAYGTHRTELAKIIIEATDPSKPRTQTDTRRRIREKWDALTTAQVERISRTETANVWETTNMDTMAANGVQQLDWLVAKGPSIGPPKSLPVCRECLRMASGGPYRMGEVEPPPRHPNCRCTMIPSLSVPFDPHAWLPPAEPWHGTHPQLPTVATEL